MIRTFHLTDSGEVRVNLQTTEIGAAIESGGALWVDFFQATQEEHALLSEVFHFHPLAIEDCMEPSFRPKVDAFDNHIFLTLHAPDLSTRGGELDTLEMNAFLGRNFLVTVHSVPLPSIEHALQQCEKAPSRTLGRGADFLLYSILDDMADNYSPYLRRSETQVTQIEEAVLEGQTRKDLLPELMYLRRDLLGLRQVLAAQRDAVNLLTQQGPPLISERARVYFRDVADLYQRVLEVTEIQRDALAGVRDTYFTMISNRTNEIMKTVTIMATIMLPPTVVSGIHGMNFRVMPEIEWTYGYPFSLGLMACIVGGMLYYFRRKRWL